MIDSRNCLARICLQATFCAHFAIDRAQESAEKIVKKFFQLFASTLFRRCLLCRRGSYHGLSLVWIQHLSIPLGQMVNFEAKCCFDEGTGGTNGRVDFMTVKIVTYHRTYGGMVVTVLKKDPSGSQNVVYHCSYGGIVVRSVIDSSIQKCRKGLE